MDERWIMRSLICDRHHTPMQQSRHIGTAPPPGLRGLDQHLVRFIGCVTGHIREMSTAGIDEPDSCTPNQRSPLNRQPPRPTHCHVSRPSATAASPDALTLTPHRVPGRDGTAVVVFRAGPGRVKLELGVH
jgi:hypothetical protein